MRHPVAEHRVDQSRTPFYSSRTVLWPSLVLRAGRGCITAVDPQGRTFIDDVGVGDLWKFPAGIPHSIQGLEEGCEFLLVFDDGNFSENETFLISDWFAHTPPEVLAKNFGVAESTFANLPGDVNHTHYIFAGEVEK
jgi:oxalate decarboxylase